MIVTMLYGSGVDTRSSEIQLRRERAEKDLHDLRLRQRQRLNSTGSVSSASSDCSATPRIVSAVGTG